MEKLPFSMTCPQQVASRHAYYVVRSSFEDPVDHDPALKRFFRKLVREIPSYFFYVEIDFLTEYLLAEDV